LSPETKSIRAFVAIQLPEAVLSSLRAVQSELREFLPLRSAAWTHTANLHLTLRFLGGVNSANLPGLTRRLRESVAGFGPLELRCERLGCFPDLRFPRVVWAWVHDAEGRLPDLERRVNAAVADFAEQAAEARFVGHVTLLRPRQIKRPEAERLAEFVQRAAAREFGRWTCREVELIQSQLSATGSCYTTLDVFPL